MTRFRQAGPYFVRISRLGWAKASQGIRDMKKSSFSKQHIAFTPKQADRATFDEVYRMARSPSKVPRVDAVGAQKYPASNPRWRKAEGHVTPRRPHNDVWTLIFQQVIRTRSRISRNSSELISLLNYAKPPAVAIY